MPITFLPKGDIFESDAVALVNPVNCVGVMGKGLALRFSRRYREPSASYRRVCDAGLMLPGTILVTWWAQEGTNETRYVVHAATKDHWRDRSKVEWINTILEEIRNFCITSRIESIAIPMIGCGEGGLDWTEVCVLIHHWLGDLDRTDITVYGEDVCVPA